MAKFKVGDIIMAEVPKMGVDEAEIVKVDTNNYYCKIVRGTLVLPIIAERNYILKT